MAPRVFARRGKEEEPDGRGHGAVSLLGFFGFSFPFFYFFLLRLYWFGRRRRTLVRLVNRLLSAPQRRQRGSAWLLSDIATTQFAIGVAW